MICELCGQNTPFLKPLLVEGSLLKVCNDCAKFGKDAPVPSSPGSASGTGGSAGMGAGAGSGARSGTGSIGGTGAGYRGTNYSDQQSKDEIIKRRLEMRDRRKRSKDIYEQGGEAELVEDFHKRIQQARNSQGWSQEDLGQKINERKSVISKIESKSMKPDDKLVRKLEKALNIKLMEVIE